MAIWIQSLSWTLLFSLAQGLLVYTVLRLVFKLLNTNSANLRYHLSLSALTILLAWFVATWWQQFHSLTLINTRLLAAHTTTTVFWLPLPHNLVLHGLNDLYAAPSLLSSFFPWLSAFYIAGLALMLARFSAGMLQLYSLRTSSTIEPGAALNQLLHAQKERIRLYTPVKLLISAKAQVPMVIGFLKPIILLPAAAIAQLEPRQLETIILHELAHIKRHDYLINILQAIVETILFFNPFVWLIATITRQEREHCCDDMVVNHTPEPIFYAEALVALATRHTTVPRIIVAASVQPTHLFNRIQRIMEMKKNPFSYSRMVASVIIIATITASIAWVKPGFPKVKKGKSVAVAAKQKKSLDKTPQPFSHAVTVGGNSTFVNTDKTPTATQPPAEKQLPPAYLSEENQLVAQLLEDKVVDQVKGFIVEKRQDKLYINGLLVKEEIANKYLSNLKQEAIRVQVMSLDARLRMHPDASFIQLLLPVTFSSPCVDKAPVKEGC